MDFQTITRVSPGYLGQCVLDKFVHTPLVLLENTKTLIQRDNLWPYIAGKDSCRSAITEASIQSAKRILQFGYQSSGKVADETAVEVIEVESCLVWEIFAIDCVVQYQW